MNGFMLRGGPLAALALLAACAETPPPPLAAGPRIFASDLAGGARTCTVPPAMVLAAGQQQAAEITLANDGGWCGVLVSQAGPQAFRLGLVAARPEHGRLNIHSVGAQTRVDYIPDPGYVGPDRFGVTLQPGGAALAVGVTVQAGPAAVVPAAAAPPATPPRRPARTPRR